MLMKKEYQEYLVELLTLVKNKFQVENKNPSLCIGENGRLWMWIPIGEIYQSIIFDEEYEDKTPTELFNSICDDLKNAGYKF